MHAIPPARSFRLAAVLAALAAAAPAAAQAPKPQAPKPKPYPVIAVTLADETPTDPAFAAFRQQLADAVARKDRAALRALVLPTFFWQRDFGGGFDRKRSAAENFERAVGFGSEGRDFDGVAALIAHERVGRDPRAKVLCTPPTPRYDEAAFDKALAQTDSDGLDWGVPLRAGVALRAEPKADAPAVATLPLALVRGLDWYAEGTPTGPAWHRMAAPGGAVGYVASADVMTLVEEKLCFAKGKDGKWGIAGYVGGGD